MFKRTPDLTPRNGKVLFVAIVARISGCAKQKDVSLTDQVDHGKKFVREMYPEGEIVWHEIATKGKGERLDRPELQELRELIESDTIDLLFVEDLGRLVRGTAAKDLCGLAYDHGTRVISPNDCIDTADESWEEDVIAACRDHVGHNSHTSKRLKRKMSLRFQRSGECVALPIAGYLKSQAEDEKSYHDWKKDESAAPAIRAGFDLLLLTLNCSAVADLFNQTGFSPGRYCTQRKWKGAMVRRFYANPILKGTPARGFKHTIKNHQSGKRVSVKNPDGPKFIDCPHLAYLTADEFDELNLALRQRNERYRRGRQAADPRLRCPRKRTRFPGQYACCWYCGREYVWGGNGQTNHLQCSGSRSYECWNSVGFEGRLLGEKMAASLVELIAKLPDLQLQIDELLKCCEDEVDDSPAKQLETLQKEIAALESAESNLADSLAELGPLPFLQKRSQELTAKRAELGLKEFEVNRLLRESEVEELDLTDWQAELTSGLQILATGSADFPCWIREIITSIEIHLVRLVDGGHLCSRARVHFDLLPQLELESIPEELRSQLTGVLTIDLFEPVQREAIRQEAYSLFQQAVPITQIGPAITGKPTLPAVQRAIKLQQLMLEQDLESPYVLIESPPADYPKLRRHRHHRYQFKPLEGYVLRAL
jgi:hypothetical protein